MWLFSIDGCTIRTSTVLKPLKRDWNQASILIADIWNYGNTRINLKIKSYTLLIYDAKTDTRWTRKGDKNVTS